MVTEHSPAFMCSVFRAPCEWLPWLESIEAGEAGRQDIEGRGKGSAADLIKA